MSAENGIPVDKCPRCGMYASKDMAWKHTRYFCDSNSDGITFHQSPACNRIAELQEQLEKAYQLADLEFYRTMQKAELAVERGNRLRECRLRIEELQEQVKERENFIRVSLVELHAWRRFGAERGVGMLTSVDKFEGDFDDYKPELTERVRGLERA